MLRMKYVPNGIEHPALPVSAIPRRPGPDVGRGRLADLPVHRSIVALDIERSTSALRTNLVKRELRGRLYRMLEVAMVRAGIGKEHCDPFEDRGDGVLVLIHPVDEIPKAYLLSRLLPELARLLAEHNHNLPPADLSRRELRLRVVVHAAGEIHRDDRGYFGEALDLACRLLDAPKLKKYLREVAEPLALVVSEDIFRSVVKHDYDGIRAETFRSKVRVQVAGRHWRGWVHVPAAPPGAEAPVPVAPGRGETPGAIA